MNRKITKTFAVLMILAVAITFAPQSADASWWSDFWNWLTGQSTCPSCDESVSNTSDHQVYCGTCGIDYYTCGQDVHGSNCDKEICPSCGNEVESDGAHYVICGEGHGYYTCDYDAYMEHSTH